MSDSPEEKLTQEQKDYVAKWLLEKGGTPARPCSVCNNSTWVVGDHVLAPLRLQKGAFVLSAGSVYPFVPVICTNCGNTHSLNAVVMKLPNWELKND